MLGRPIATAPLATLSVELAVSTQSVTVRYASESFITRSSDNPADTFIAGRIASGLEIGRELTRAANGQFGSLIEARFGEIALNNDDRALDPLINDYYADGREIRLKIGAKEIVQFSRLMPLYVATGGGSSSGNDAVPYPMDYPTGLFSGDLLIAQITINDRGSIGPIEFVSYGADIVSYGGEDLEF